ncbi:Stationary-phase survival protein SurE, putative [Moritella viscosa]|uniref:5'/3'-nucleotidase SurE n=1 Tax=Moritella viscosa TaxID=80854 RepID=UPI00091F1EED|nr:5'/3'-nucleotidase SurE [Moritella viscosa]SGZ10882.1 Stationary-phase survival protein SurE, putative [Moritella viscosa]
MKINIKTGLLSALITQAIFSSAPASALNIVLTNDDNWNSHNIKAMKDALVAKHHDVIIAAPCTEQSGKGGSFSYFNPVKVDMTRESEYEYCIGDVNTTQEFNDYVEGTPVMSVLYGIDIAAQKKWEKAPDLVVSGPNKGHNLGYMNNSSGTLGAAMIALSRGIPAIAVSSHRDSKDYDGIANVVIKVIDELETKRTDKTKPLLPIHMGLNINIPKDLENNSDYHFTDVGWNAGDHMVKFFEDLGVIPNVESYSSKNLKGQHGVGFVPSDIKDSNENSEGAMVNRYITISTIDGSLQARRGRAALTKKLLSGLKQK